MAVFQIESGTAHGRGFADADTDGFLAKFYTWVTKGPLSGGPMWTILLDKSATPVGDDVDSLDDATEELTLTGHDFYTAERVKMTTTGTVPTGFSTSTTYYVIKVDANTIKLATTLENAYDGTAVNFTGSGSGTHTVTLEGPYVICSNTVAADLNTSQMLLKVGMVTTEAGYVRVNYFLGWDITNKIPMSAWSGYAIQTYDDADFEYNFRGGEESMIIQSRLGTAWHTALIDKFIGDANRLEATDKTGELQSGVTAGSSVVLQLDTGEAANFTADNYYFIHDFDGHNWLEYVQVTAVDAGTDQVTVDTISHNYPSGAIIAAYTHRWYTMGNGTDSSPNVEVNPSSSHVLKIPYVSSQTEVNAHYDGSQMYGGCKLGKMTEDLDTESPNDENKYAVQKPTINEYQNFSASATDMNRGYGTTNNVYITYDTSLARGQDGRTINSKDYLFFQNEYDIASGSSNYAMLFLHTESMS